MTFGPLLVGFQGNMDYVDVGHVVVGHLQTRSLCQ